MDIVWYGEPHLPFIDVLDIAGAPASSGKPCYIFAYLGSFAMFEKRSSSTSGDSLTPFPRVERRLGPPSCWDESRIFKETPIILDGSYILDLDNVFWLRFDA